MMRTTIISVILVLDFLHVHAQTLLPYKNADLPINLRVKDLLARMTTEEKSWQLFMMPGDLDKADSTQYKDGLFGFQVSAVAQGDAGGQMLNYGATENAYTLAKKVNSIQKYFVEQTRLGIPIIPFDEALHGLVRNGATVFPQAIGLAASWDTVLVHDVAAAIAKEARVRGIRDVLSPVINIASDVRWGRTEETYGEDPYLTARMAVAFVSAFEKRGVITTPKHFIANVGDGGRDSYPIHFDERLLDEIYFPPFKACIREGGSRSIMTAYNSLDGVPCSDNKWLLQTKLKDEWGFKGFVISDANALGGDVVLHYTARNSADASCRAINAGLDVVFQTDYNHHGLFVKPFLNSCIDTPRMNDAVARVLRAKFELGLFDHPYVSETRAKEWVHNFSHKPLARKAADEGVVLLKNDGNALPVAKGVHTIAVIGEDALSARLGGYSGPGNRKFTILEGIKERAEKGGVKVLYAKGCDIKTPEWQVIPATYLSTITNGETIGGLQGEYFNNITLSGQSAIKRIDKNINFKWTISAPDDAITPDFYSVRWTGKLKAPVSGTYKIGLDGDDGYRLFINNKLVIDNWKKQSYSTRLIDFSFKKDEQYDIRVEFFEPAAEAHIKLIWTIGADEGWNEEINKAVAIAHKADMVVVTAGIIEGEFQDRAMLGLPGHQEELINRLAATGKPVTVVLVGGSAITMSHWLSSAASVLDVWYPGEEGGHAVADVLFGDYNPAGRLPVTFPINEAQLPLVYNHKPTGRGDDYNNLSGLPLFPFGFGLSYTTFTYSDIRLDNNNIDTSASTVVHCKVTNTGARAGDEVVQLYIHDMLSSVARPVMELKGFQRVHFKPNETKDISFAITPTMLSMLNEQMQTVVEPGDFRIMIGASSRDIRLKTILTVK